MIRARRTRVTVARVGCGRGLSGTRRREAGSPERTPTGGRAVPEPLGRRAAGGAESLGPEGWGARLPVRGGAPGSRAHTPRAAGAEARARSPRARAAPRRAACGLARSGKGRGERVCACAGAGSALGETLGERLPSHVWDGGKTLQCACSGLRADPALALSRNRAGGSRRGVLRLWSER